MQARGHRFESVILHKRPERKRTLTYWTKETYKRNKEKSVAIQTLESNVTKKIYSDIEKSFTIEYSRRES